MSGKVDVDGDMSVERVGESTMSVITCSSVVVASSEADEHEGPSVMVVVDRHAFSLRTREQLDHLIACLRDEADRTWPESAPRSS